MGDLNKRRDSDVEKLIGKETGNILEDVKLFLQKVVTQEALYKIKVDYFQKNVGASSNTMQSSQGYEIPGLNH